MNKTQKKYLIGLGALGLAYLAIPKKVVYRRTFDDPTFKRVGKITRVLLSPISGSVQYEVMTKEGPRTIGGSAELFKLKRF